MTRFLVQVRKRWTRHDRVQVICDRTDIFCDGPLVVVEHHDEAFGMRFYIVKRFVADSAGERGVARNDHDMVIAAAQVPAYRHTESGRKRCARVASTVAIVFALGAQEKAIKAAELAHRMKTIQPPGKHFVDVALMAYVHDESVARRVEHAVQGNRQFNHAKIWAEMSAG